MSFVVGLTGGIGSGKSAVANLFAAHGVPVVDTDVIAHELTAAQGLAMPAISAEFGQTVVAPDGRLDRDAMRRLVFSDVSVKARLEAILHPLIRSESDARCAAATYPYVVLVVPLLIETGAYRQRIQRVLVVDCDESTQVARVVQRSGLGDDEIRTIMKSQASRAQRLAVADDVLSNDGGLEDLAPRVLDLHRRYIELAYDRSRTES
jgi:dephospho-CoA kinase